MSSYNRIRQIKAARQRKKDAQEIIARNRFTAAMYLGGYAIECGLKALICFNERKSDFKDTKLFLSGVPGGRLHNLLILLQNAPQLQRSISLDASGKLQNSWKLIVSHWDTNALRYSERPGELVTANNFIIAVGEIFREIMSLQNETP